MNCFINFFPNVSQTMPQILHIGHHLLILCMANEVNKTLEIDITGRYGTARNLSNSIILNVLDSLANMECNHFQR